MRNAEWPARMQRHRQGRLRPIVPDGTEIWLEAVTTRRRQSHRRDVGGPGRARLPAANHHRRLASTKDLDGFLRHFVGLSSHIVAVAVPSREECWSPAEIVTAARKQNFSAIACTDLESALSKAKNFKTESAPRILITGSLHLVGRALALNGTPPN